MKKVLLSIALIGLFQNNIVSQTNGFVISMMNNQFLANNGIWITTPTYGNGNPSSVLNVLSEDGFNTSYVFFPDKDISYEQYIRYLQLCRSNGMKLIDMNPFWFKPSCTGPCTTGIGFKHSGINQYNVGPSSSPSTNAIYYNYDALYSYLYNNISNDSTLHNSIYMHELGDEMTFFHYFPKQNAVVGYDDAVTCGIYGNPDDPHIENANPQMHIAAEIPPQNLSDAIGYFKGYNLPNQKYAIGIATHGTSIEKFDDPSRFNSYPMHGCNTGNPNCDYCGVYYVKDHLIFPGISSPNKADIIREASYYNTQYQFWELTTWQANNYLGKLDNIDYLHAKGYNHIISEQDLDFVNSSTLPYQYHSNPNVPNNNMLRFLNYSSIIHGVDGVNFYTLSDAYGFDAGDTAKENAIYDWQATDQTTRFIRSNFPYMYNAFISKLSREIRYLANKNFVSPNNSNLIYKKTTSSDTNGILPASANYLPATILAADARDYNALKGYSPSNTLTNNHRTEDYGLRYIITTNGSGEAVMIVSNPNPYSVHNVSFNFNQVFSSNTLDSIVDNTKSIDVLFEDGLVTDVNSTSYKTDQSASVGPGPTFDLIKKYSLPFCNKQFTSDFGPFDVKIFYFNSLRTGSPAYTTLGWAKQWSNNGNGIIGSWGGAGSSIATDKFIPIDFDKDGDEELLCVQSINSGGPSSSSNAWATVLNYNGTSWSSMPMWTNNGNGSFNSSGYSGWGIYADDKYIVGDFDSDGRNNEILCIHGDSATILQSNGSTFNNYWTNSGSGIFGGWGLLSTDKFMVGDFNNDGKNNDLLSVQGLNSGWWAIHNFSSGNFTWLWGSGSGKLLEIPSWTIGSADEFIVGDYDGDGQKREILCMERTTGNNVSIIRKDQWYYTATSVWSTTSGNIGGWGAPLLTSDKVLVADLDAVDSKDELMFIQTCANCSYATTEDLNGANNPTWNWSNHNSTGPQQNFIGDWRVNDTCATDVKYLFIKPTTTSKKQLLAFKNYGGTYLISMYQTDFTGSNYKIAGNQTDVSPLVKKEAVSVFNLYPNPNDGSFILTADDTLKRNIIIIKDVFGKTVAEYSMIGRELSIDLKNQPKGFYFVNVMNDSKSEVKKVIIE